MKFFSLLVLLFIANVGRAQTDTLQQESTEEEDFSIYENYDFTDESAKRYCTPKVLDLSPAKLMWIGYDHQGQSELTTDSLIDGDKQWNAGTSTFKGAGGLRVGANVPVIAKTNVVLQAGFNFWRVNYTGFQNAEINPLSNSLKNNGLTTLGLTTTLFKPINDRNFMIVQASGDLNGDYQLNNIIPLKYTRYSAAALFGVKSSDRKMIAFGLSRTYRVGEINYIPVMLLNWTHPNRKWGIEMLAPARAQVRWNFSPRKLLFFGYELEGNSYRVLSQSGLGLNNYELRRSELRFRFIWEQSIHKFIWLSFQAGYRYNYAFNLDQFPNDREFFRGFFGDQQYKMTNSMSGTWYSLITLNLVSP